MFLYHVFRLRRYVISGFFLKLDICRGFFVVRVVRPVFSCTLYRYFKSHTHYIPPTTAMAIKNQWDMVSSSTDLLDANL